MILTLTQTKELSDTVEDIKRTQLHILSVLNKKFKSSGEEEDIDEEEEDGDEEGDEGEDGDDRSDNENEK